jgi:hypothetical protein
MMTSQARHYLIFISWYKDDSEDETAVMTGAGTTTAALTPVPRMDPCELWMHIVPELNSLITMNSKEWSIDQYDMKGFWDRRVAAQYIRTSVADLQDFWNNYPNFVPQAYLENMIYNLSGWQRIWNTYDHLNSTVCIRFEIALDSHGTTSSSSPNHAGVEDNSTAIVERRFVQPDIAGDSEEQRILDPNNEIPLLSTILSGIRLSEYTCNQRVSAHTLIDHLSLHYARWAHYAGSGEFGPGLVVVLDQYSFVY